VSVDLPDMGEIGSSAMPLLMAEAAVAHETLKAANPGRYGPYLGGFIEGDLTLRSVDTARALAAREEYSGQMAAVLMQVDAILLPTLPGLPPSDERVTGISDDVGELSAEMIAFTMPFNVAQLAALNIPCEFAEGLPIGLQLAVASLEEQQRLIDLGRAFQAVTKFHL
jgi:Asp-tRNA(Asn)/Glu-tRNA(Gln) amidotransferase A subunit family amidase